MSSTRSPVRIRTWMRGMALSQPHRAGVAAVIVSLVAALGVFALIDRSTSPSRSGDGSQEGVGALRSGQSATQRIAVLQGTLRLHPGNADLWAALGSAYYQRVRETGDASYYAKADGVLRTALRLDPRNVSATVGTATVALGRHDFRGGLAAAQRAQRLAPEADAAYPALIDGLVELGRYPEAGRTIQRFVDLKPTLASYARVSYFRELHGDLPGAVEAMQYAVSAGGDAPENVAYVQALLGDIQFVRGRVTAAAAAYRLALARVPGYPPASAGLAQVEGARAEYPPAISRLRDVVARLPLPQYIVALGETELAAGRRAQAAHDLALVGAEEQLLRANGVNTDVDLALFEANHGTPTRAVTLGRRAWAQAPSVRSADALGWALTRAGRPAQGLHWARRALELGSRDPSFLYHAGMSARSVGARAAAREYLRRALALNPRFSPLYAPRARGALRGIA